MKPHTVASSHNASEPHLGAQQGLSSPLEGDRPAYIEIGYVNEAGASFQLQGRKKVEQKGKSPLRWNCKRC